MVILPQIHRCPPKAGKQRANCSSSCQFGTPAETFSDAVNKTLVRCVE